MVTCIDLHAFRRLVKSLTALLIVPYQLQSGFQLGDRLWLRLQFVIPFQHGPPHVIVKGVEIWGIWWPTVLFNDLRTVCVQPLLRDTCCVCWSAILLENEPGWHQLLAVLDRLNFHSLYGNYYFCSASLLTQRLHSHFVRMRHLSHFNCVNKMLV